MNRSLENCTPNENPTAPYKDSVEKKKAGQSYVVQPLATEPSSTDNLWKSVDKRSASVITGKSKEEIAIHKSDSEVVIPDVEIKVDKPLQQAAF